MIQNSAPPEAERLGPDRASGASATVTIQARPTAAGALEVVARAEQEPKAADPNPANDQAAVSTQLQ